MNKKQLTLQNSSLFAELERKAKEIEILNIRLEDSEKKSNSLKNENDQLRNGINEANFEIQNLNSKIKILKEDYENQIELLKNELDKTKESATAPTIPVAMPEAAICTESVVHNDEEVALVECIPEEPITVNLFEEPTTPEPEENTDFSPEEGITAEPEDAVCESEDGMISEPEETLLPHSDEKSCEPDLDKPMVVNKEDLKPNSSYTSTESVIQEAPGTDSAAVIDALRDHGAKIIGKVTRVTAEVISKIDPTDEDAAASLKTLALGKNESFKFKIMELAKRGGDLERVMAEMDFLADEAIIYLRSI